MITDRSDSFIDSINDVGIIKKMEVLKSKEVKLHKFAKLKFLYSKNETKIFIVLS